MPVNTDLQAAITTIRAYQSRRDTFVRYYEGVHELAFATDKFKTAFGRTLKGMRDNLCPIVVDAPADRMEVINFAGDKKDEKSAVADAAWSIWQREQMELLSNSTHVEALKTSAAYVIVWGDESNTARFYLQDSRNCCVIEDEETGTPLFAAKQWKMRDKKIRVTLYYPDRIEKFVTGKESDQWVELKDEHFVVFEDTVPNPYGVIPMFAFEASPVLSDAIPIQDALNKTICDKLVAMEFSAFRQRWVTGLEPDVDEFTGVPKTMFEHGVAKLWFTNDKDAKFGEFNVTDLKQFLDVADSFRLEMARVSGTPIHFFSVNTSDAISGEALKTLESRFVKKVKRLCLNFGSVWARAMRLALAIEGKPQEGSLTVQWESPEQRSEKEFLEAQLLKQDLGVPTDTLLEEYGYTAEDISKFNAETPDVPDVDPAVNAARKMANGG